MNRYPGEVSIDKSLRLKQDAIRITGVNKDVSDGHIVENINHPLPSLATIDFRVKDSPIQISAFFSTTANEPERSQQDL